MSLDPLELVMQHRRAPAKFKAPEAATQPDRWIPSGVARVPNWSANNAFDEGFYLNTYLYACIMALAQDLSACPIRVGNDPDEKDKWDKRYPLAQLLGPLPGGPMPGVSARKVIAWLIVQRMVTGRMCLEIVKGPDGTPQSLWPVPASRVTPIVSDEPSKWFSQLRIDTGIERITRPIENYFYDWIPRGTDWREPEAPIEALKLDISVATMQDIYDYAFLRNDARPAAMVVHQQFAEQGEKTAFRRQWTRRHQGVNNAGRVMFIEAEDGNADDVVKVIPIGLTQRDGEFIERYKMKIQAITVGLGVPLSRIGDASGRTFSNASEEGEVYIDRLRALGDEIAEAFNSQIAPLFGEQVCWFDFSKYEDDSANSKIIATGAKDLLMLKVIKRNEVRTALGLKPDKDIPDEYLTDAEIGLLQNAAAQLIVPQATIDTTTGNIVLEEYKEPPAPPALGTASQAGASAEAQEPPDPEDMMQQAQRASLRVVEMKRMATWHRTEAEVGRLENIFEKRVERLLEKQKKAVLSRIEGKRGRQMLTRAAGNAADFVDNVFDREHWTTETEDEMRSLYELLTSSAASRLYGELGVNFGLHNADADEFISTRANQLAGNVTETTYNGIKDQLVEGINAGEGIPELAGRIRDLFDQTYASRAKTVARTEVIGGYNGATRMAADGLPDDVVVGYEWISTPGTRTRPTHSRAHGQQVRRGDKFHVGGFELDHPGAAGAPAKEVVNCRCTLGILTPDDAVSFSRAANVVPFERRTMPVDSARELMLRIGLQDCTIDEALNTLVKES